jgi:hypothetical protein
MFAGIYLMAAIMKAASALPETDASHKERPCDPREVANRGQSSVFRIIEPQIGVDRNATITDPASASPFPQ